MAMADSFSALSLWAPSEESCITNQTICTR
jgi:hypothetical protein